MDCQERLNRPPAGLLLWRALVAAVDDTVGNLDVHACQNRFIRRRCGEPRTPARRICWLRRPSFREALEIARLRPACDCGQQRPGIAARRSDRARSGSWRPRQIPGPAPKAASAEMAVLSRWRRPRRPASSCHGSASPQRRLRAEAHLRRGDPALSAKVPCKACRSHHAAPEVDQHQRTGQFAPADGVEVLRSSAALKSANLRAAINASACRNWPSDKAATPPRPDNMPEPDRPTGRTQCDGYDRQRLVHTKIPNEEVR